jgi:mRNA-degrading endonuclease RelE of RelBE toxin-antitoxin system
MKYTVLWTPQAEQELAALWLDSTRREAVTQAANAIEQRLQRDAHEQGESRGEGERIVFSDPLGVLFRVDVQSVQVLVFKVWAIRRKGK